MWYTIPKVDVLVATVFQSQPGTELTASLTYDKSELVWNPASASRATEPCLVAAQGVGCLRNTGMGFTTTTVVVPLLLANESYGPRINLFDVKLAKNIRFHGKRLSVGADIYNIFNSDGITSYNTTYTRDNPATPQNENLWGQPMLIVPPRFVRAQVQLNF